ncbi:MAG TPA: ABC transporter ATP-binding protein [Pyrinomonadaceae bacterium]|jgi:lipopolysaccharide transport system ATP-binding protein|nr:ABC transporter ATP-binding protein [Pyrinomonadaceae bacterium]
MDPIIKVEQIGKRYKIGSLDAGYATFRETIAGVLAKPIRRMLSTAKQSGEDLWALRDVSFNVAEGEVVGLIGNNGAGKSTLLKILSRITIPTTGRTEVHGRIGSLLEVGTGFHPDLTGRENIYLNGTILGIKRSAIKRRFDEIVAFSELEKFIDTPVKWYSSGMYLRLAFAVAVHLDTEVLIMDEVLAVGDLSFQQKCLDKMHEIRNEGRTILFVSHSMTAVTRLCQRVILLEKGRKIADGPAPEVINDYIGSTEKVTNCREWPDRAEAPGNDIVYMRRARVCDEHGNLASSINIQDPIGIELTYEVCQPGKILVPRLDVLSEDGVHVFSSHDVSSEWLRQPRHVGTYRSLVQIPGNLLAGGNHFISFSLMSHYPETVLHAQVSRVLAFQVVDNFDPGSARGDFLGPIPGVVRPLLNWNTARCEDHYEETRAFREEAHHVALSNRNGSGR